MPAADATREPSLIFQRHNTRGVAVPAAATPLHLRGRRCDPSGVACVEALEAAGWQVVMLQAHVCCGRPLADHAFLDTAER